jgi:glycosyltransferase involved in cell wall biosynthesis
MTSSTFCTHPALQVAIVTETYPPEVNGVAMTLGRMVTGLLARGHRVHLTRPRQNADDRARTDDAYCETLVLGLPIPGYRGLRVGVPARILLRKQWQLKRPDVVQVATEGPLGAAAIAAARALNIPVVSEFHTNFHTYSKHYGFGWLEGLVAAHLRRLHNRSALTLVPTQALANELAAEGYRNLRVVSRGIDNELFHPCKRSTELRRQWGVTDDQLVVSYVGRIAAEKNLPLVLKAFDAICQHLPSARLLLVGDGPLRKRLGRDYPQHIYAGMRHGEDLAAHYASADLFLFPSLTETFGNVTAEALASGLPVVAYRTRLYRAGRGARPAAS